MRAFRLGLPAAILVAGLVLIIIGGDAPLGAGIVLIGVAGLVALGNVLIQLGLQSERDRAEQERRRHERHVPRDPPYSTIVQSSSSSGAHAPTSGPCSSWR